MKKFTIGIPGYKNSNADSFGAGITHLEFISKFGNPRIIMPWEEHVEVDLLYLPGGLDTAPAGYGEVPSFRTSNHDVFKEFFFKERLKNYIGNTPIFGVCLGAQMLAVHFGSKLTQDLIYHEQSKSRWETAHEVTSCYENGQLYYKGKGIMKFDVNSHHHQCVTVKNLGQELKPILFAENMDGFLYDDETPIVECFIHEKHKIVGVQWHPEELYDSFSMETIKNLLKTNKAVNETD